MANQTGNDEGATGCLFLVGAAALVWLAAEAVRKMVEAVMAALHSLWQFATWLFTTVWDFLLQPSTLTFVGGTAAVYLLGKVAKKYLAGLNVTVGADEAVLVERWGKPEATLYRGRHRLPLGALVRSRLSLRPLHCVCNEEELLTSDHLSVRLRCSFDLHITNPRLRYDSASRAERWRATVAYHQRNDQADLRRRCVGQVFATARQALTREVLLTEFAQLLARPETVNQGVAEQLNLLLSNQGLKAANFRIEELIQPDELLKLRYASGADAYWEKQAGDLGRSEAAWPDKRRRLSKAS